LTRVKQSLVRKLGDLDESVYGYIRLKELMRAGKRLGYFAIGRNDKGIDYVFLNKERKR
jgi:hypothetical protein